MKGNFHVQFLGGWGAAMLPGYPARLDSLVIKGLAAYLIARGSFVATAMPLAVYRDELPGCVHGARLLRGDY